MRIQIRVPDQRFGSRVNRPDLRAIRQDNDVIATKTRITFPSTTAAGTSADTQFDRDVSRTAIELALSAREPLQRDKMAHQRDRMAHTSGQSRHPIPIPAAAGWLSGSNGQSHWNGCQAQTASHTESHSGGVVPFDAAATARRDLGEHRAIRAAPRLARTAVARSPLYRSTRYGPGSRP